LIFSFWRKERCYVKETVNWNIFAKFGTKNSERGKWWSREKSVNHPCDKWKKFTLAILYFHYYKNYFHWRKICLLFVSTFCGMEINETSKNSYFSSKTFGIQYTYCMHHMWITRWKLFKFQINFRYLNYENQFQSQRFDHFCIWNRGASLSYKTLPLFHHLRPVD